jgi:hypothetical protein
MRFGMLWRLRCPCEERALHLRDRCLGCGAAAAHAQPRSRGGKVPRAQARIMRACLRCACVPEITVREQV